MQNPWIALPEAGSLVLAQDEAPLRDFNERASEDARLDVSLYPEPFFGRPDAPVVLLALNPGLGGTETATHADPAFARAARKSLSHELQPLPFLHLQQPASTPGGAWWRRITRSLIEGAGIDAVARSLLCVQLLGYHSRAFGAHKLCLPSQAYGFHLVKEAMRREALIICMRSWRLWCEAVPKLATYPRLHRIRNARNPALSPANLPDGYDAVLETVRRSS